ncbi:hypothetical protein L6V77_23765 [Myxococcota bacterium]|nr:hypothetical protein [Myxococcota bacterium]
MPPRRTGSSAARRTRAPAFDPAAGADAAFDSGAGGELTVGVGVEDPDAPTVAEFSIYAEGGGEGRWTPGSKR